MLPSEGTGKSDSGVRHTRDVGANHDLCVLPHAKLINAFQLFRTEVEAVQTLDLPQAGEWQGEDHCVEGLRLCAARRVKASHDLPVLVIEFRSARSPDSSRSLFLSASTSPL